MSGIPTERYPIHEEDLDKLFPGWRDWASYHANELELVEYEDGTFRVEGTITRHYRFTAENTPNWETLVERAKGRKL